MQCRPLCRCLGLVIVAFVLSGFSAQPAMLFYDNAAAFAAATSNVTTNNFEGLAPDNSFKNYSGPDWLTTYDVEFKGAGSGPFGVGDVTVLGGAYAAGQSAVYDTGTGAILIYTPPNEPGTAYLYVHLPEGITAVGTNLWAVQPYIATLQIDVYAYHEEIPETLNLTTVKRPTASYFGVTSDVPISSLQFFFPAGQVGVILDNFSIGDAGIDPPNTVPEPATIVLVGAVLLGVGLFRRSKRA